MALGALLCLATLRLAFAVQLSLHTDLSYTPLLAWSNKKYFDNDDSVKVLREVLSNPSEKVIDVVKSAAGLRESQLGNQVLVKESGADAKPSVIVVFVGTQLASSDLRKPARADALQRLRQTIESSASSFAVPFVASQGSSRASYEVYRSLKEDGIAVEEVNCGPEPVDDFKAATLAAMSTSSDKDVKVVVVCSERGPQLSLDGLTREVELVETVQDVLENSGTGYMVVYTSTADAKTVVSARRRGLQSSSSSISGFGPYTSCDVRCQAQVRWLEGMLALLILALASCAGMTCLYLLDTPTKFETPKEEARRE